MIENARLGFSSELSHRPGGQGSLKNKNSARMTSLLYKIRAHANEITCFKNQLKVRCKVWETNYSLIIIRSLLFSNSIEERNSNLR